MNVVEIVVADDIIKEWIISLKSNKNAFNIKKMNLISNRVVVEENNIQSAKKRRSNDKYEMCYDHNTLTTIIINIRIRRIKDW